MCMVCYNVTRTSVLVAPLICSATCREAKSVWKVALPTPGSSMECGAIPFLVQRTLSLPNSRATYQYVILSLIAFRKSVLMFKLL